MGGDITAADLVFVIVMICLYLANSCLWACQEVYRQIYGFSSIDLG